MTVDVVQELRPGEIKHNYDDKTQHITVEREIFAGANFCYLAPEPTA